MFGHRKRDQDGVPPGPSFMSNQQMSAYLQDLRSGPPARPTGARPPPASFVSHRQSLSRLSMVAPSKETVASRALATDIPARSSSAAGFHRNDSEISVSASVRGRPMIRSPSGAPQIDVPLEGESSSAATGPQMPYIERGARWMEKQEARSLRKAMEDMELDEEQRLHAAAQQEASELVWKHQNPKAAFRNPDAPYDYRQHLRKGSHALSVSMAMQEASLKHRKRRDGSSSRSVSGASKDSGSGANSRSTSGSSVLPGGGEVTASAGAKGTGTQRAAATQFSEANREPARLPSIAVTVERSYTVVTADKSEIKKHSEPPVKPISTQVPANRKVSASSTKSKDDVKVSNFAVAARMASNHFRNPFARARSTRAAALERSNSTPAISSAPPRLNRIEIHRNPPSRSRDAGYTLNTQPSVENVTSSSHDEVESVRMKEGKEIRGDDIRKATSMSLKDRSPNLPTPVMVSDTPGRPIVSFDPNYKPSEIVLKEEISAIGQISPVPSPIEDNGVSPSLHSDLHSTASFTQTPSSNLGFAPSRPRELNNGGPAPRPSSSRFAASPLPTVAIEPQHPMPPSIAINNIPSISIDAVPSSSSVLCISVNESMTVGSSASTPRISVEEFPSPPSISVENPPSQRPLPSITPHRPHPPHANSAPAVYGRGPAARPHITPTSSSRGGALCTSCALPISGRIVTAAGHRFHPDCFRCYKCSEALECVAFYPEPDSAVLARKERMDARHRGEPVPEDTTNPDLPYEDEQSSLAAPLFYCHLDYHELYSPRCKSCKTPIEGEVILACGSEWHVGHFFCAQCGDPFDSSTPFVEKDGYAWCVGCHTNRFSPKCKGCRKPVVDTVLKALGSEWHEGCFCCTECKGPFKDGRYFLRQGGTDPVCPACEERRLKA